LSHTDEEFNKQGRRERGEFSRSPSVRKDQILPQHILGPSLLRTVLDTDVARMHWAG